MRKILSLMAALASASALIMTSVAASAAPAGSAALPDPAQCLGIGLARRDGNIISGYGHNSCNGQGQIKIQWSRWFGWDDVAVQVLPSDGQDHWISFNCANSGTHDFRVYVWAPLNDDLVYQKSSNVLKNVNCG